MSDEPAWDDSSPDQPESAPVRSRWLSALKSTSTRRALLLTALGGLLIAGLTTALPIGRPGAGLPSYLEPVSSQSAAARGNSTFEHAAAGDCLTWPNKSPDAAAIVDCNDDHRFEVADSIDMSTFPGSEYGPDAAPPSPARIQQISQEQCQVAVQRFLGPKFDPNSRLAVSMLWSGDKAWKQEGERRLLCGLQLPGPDNQQLVFKGKVADIDQSKVWQAGTCLGIDPASNQPIDVPVDCVSPHAMEITGTVNLAEKFTDALPPEADQDQFIKDACTRMTDGYLAPVQLRTTTLTLIYSTVALPSWTAGSRQVACSVGATLGNGAWATLLNSAKGPLLINGLPPVPPPDLPPGRLDLPAVTTPNPGAAQAPSSSSGSGSSGRSGSGQGSSSQHIPQQQPTADAAPPPGPAPGPAPEPAPGAPAVGPPPGPAEPLPPA